jgi:hypothetical protein
MGWEALGPSEPRHSPDKATLSYYTKNESFASGISKIWCMFRFPREGVFIGSWGSSTDLAEAVTQKVAAGWPSRMAGQLGGTASTSFLHRLGLPLLV